MKLKKQLKQIRKGNRDALLELIDYALDEYHEEAYDNGYKSFQSDSEVHAQRMADKLLTYAEEHGDNAEDGIDYHYLSIDETAKVINDYLQNNL